MWKFKRKSGENQRKYGKIRIVVYQRTYVRITLPKALWGSAVRAVKAVVSVARPLLAVLSMDLVADPPLKAAIGRA